MSVFGGDSWAREAQYRKRRVDDLIIEGINSSAYKKLPNGKFSCLVCPQRPVLDTPLMLSSHMKGSRHQTAESKMKDRELAMKAEKNKRLALSDCSTAVSGATTCRQRFVSSNKPLIQRVQNAASDILSGRSSQGSPIQKPHDGRSYNGSGTTENPSTQDKSTSNKVGEVSTEFVSQQFDFRERREMELKFTAAGWKRDCYGRWFKDENVEFDSDEEDPNLSLRL